MSAADDPGSPEPPDEGETAGGPRPQHGIGRGAARTARSVLSALVAVLACVLVPVALLTVWLHDIVLDTDRYVSTVAPLAGEPAVQDEAVHRITEAVSVHVDGPRTASDIASWLQSQGLPPRAAGVLRQLGPQIDSAVAQTVTRTTTRIVRSDVFATVWTNANRTAHNAVVHALTGEGRGAVGVSDGTVTLDVGTAVDKVKQELLNAGLSPAAAIPAVDRQFVLFHSDELAKLRRGAHLLDVAGNWLPVVVVLIGACGVLLAHDRRRALARTALGAAFACLVVVIGLAVARHYYLDHVSSNVLSKPAAAAVFDTLVRFLRVSLRTAIVLGIVIALGVYLIGPGRLPVAVRRASEHTADSAATWAYGHRIHTGRAGTWTQQHRRWITLAALLIVALVFALWNHPTVLTIVLLVLVLLAVLALVALMAASGRATYDAQRPAPGSRDTR